MCVGVLSVGLGPGLDSMSPARSRRSASHAAGTHGWLPQKTGRPGLRRGGVGGYNLHSVPPNSPPDCGTVAHQPRAGCIRLVHASIVFTIVIMDIYIECNRIVTGRQQALECDYFNLWQHRICGTGDPSENIFNIVYNLK